MARTNYNLTAVLRQLGVKDPRELPLAEVVQPVLSVGSGDALASPLVPPTAWVGGRVLSGPGIFAACSLQALGPGGCFVRKSLITRSTAGVVKWVVQDTDPFGGVLLTVHPPQDMAAEPLRSRFRSGTVAATLTGDIPWSRIPAAGPVDIGDTIYLRNGRWLGFVAGNADVEIDVNLLVQDIQAPPNAPVG